MSSCLWVILFLAVIIFLGAFIAGYKGALDKSSESDRLDTSVRKGFWK